MMCRCCGKKPTECWRLCKSCGDILQDYLINEKGKSQCREETVGVLLTKEELELLKDALVVFRGLESVHDFDNCTELLKKLQATL